MHSNALTPQRSQMSCTAHCFPLAMQRCTVRQSVSRIHCFQPPKADRMSLTLIVRVNTQHDTIHSKGKLDTITSSSCHRICTYTLEWSKNRKNIPIGETKTGKYCPSSDIYSLASVCRRFPPMQICCARSKKSPDERTDIGTQNTPVQQERSVCRKQRNRCSLRMKLLLYDSSFHIAGSS